MDVLLGIGMAVLVVISKILGTFCEYMTALANIGGIVWKLTLYIMQHKLCHITHVHIKSSLYKVKLTKGQKPLSETDISVEAALENTSEFTADVLTETKSILGPYLSTAFGLVKTSKFLKIKKRN